MSLDREEISYAGMTSYAADALGRPDGYGTWTTPAELRLDDGRLAWTGNAGAVVTARSGMLESFALLADQSDDRILHFAGDWGVLNICGQHGLPASHFPSRYLEWLDEDSGLVCRPAGGVVDPWLHEPLDAWRSYSQKAGVILNIGAKLAKARPEQAPAAMWVPLIDFGPRHVVAGVIGGDIIPDHPRRLADVRQQQGVLAMVVQDWLSLGDVQVHYTWDGHPHFDLGGGNLFGAIGVQLALAVAKRDGLAICDECGEFFIPRRLNRPGSPRRCPKPECRDRAAKRESARRRRARERGEGA